MRYTLQIGYDSRLVKDCLYKKSLVKAEEIKRGYFLRDTGLNL